MNIRLTLILILLCMGLIVSCAANNAVNSRESLQREAQRWESFRGEGVIEIDFRGFALRKYFVVQKNADDLRLDVIDGGVMGASAEPLFSLYKGEYLVIKSPMMPALEMIDPSAMLNVDSLDTTNSIEGTMREFEEQILRDRVIEKDSLRMEFNERYQLERIVVQGSDVTILLTYNNRHDIDKLTVSLPEGKLIMTFDEITYGPQTITPLPKPDFERMDVMQLMQQQMNMNFEER